MIKAALKRHSTLFALVALMVGFEVLGRLLSLDVLDAVASLQTGAGTFGDLASAAWSGLFSPDAAFLTSRNLTNLTLQVAINGCLAIGMTLIILTGGIDLSVGSVVALTGVILGLADRALGGNLLYALPLTLAAGVAIGGVNGLLIARFAIPPFVITLGMLVIARGVALIISHSSAISPLSDGIRFLGSGFLPGTVALGLFLAGLAALIGRAVSHKQRLVSLPLALYVLGGAATVAVFTVDRGLPVPVLVMASLAAVGVTLAGRTIFGRSLYAPHNS